PVMAARLPGAPRWIARPALPRRGRLPRARGVQARRNRTLRSARVRRVHGTGPRSSLQLRARRPENISSGTARDTSRVPVPFTALGLFGPETSVLLIRQLLKALEQFLSELRARLRVESESFLLDFFDAHDSYSTSALDSLRCGPDRMTGEPERTAPQRDNPRREPEGRPAAPGSWPPCIPGPRGTY